MLTLKMKTLHSECCFYITFSARIQP